MKNESQLKRALAGALGAEVLRLERLSGGDINLAWRCELQGGEELFVKQNPSAPSGLFQAEALGLEWLRAGGGLRVPGVRYVAPASAEHALLVLEFIPQGNKSGVYAEQLGRGLAELHLSAAPGELPGFQQDNFIAVLPQANTRSPSWVDFWVERRLEPMLREAAQRGLVSRRMRAGFARLLPRLGEWLAQDAPLARLHGDLWAGNVLVGPAGEPVLIDPAVYLGRPEVDLGMMKLFGGFSEEVFRSYLERNPLGSGWEERASLYQLYPLLVHVNLFGAGYIASVESTLSRFV